MFPLVASRIISAHHSTGLQRDYASAAISCFGLVFIQADRRYISDSVPTNVIAGKAATALSIAVA
ncbi:hypothetical protein A0H81_12951, partial [Grifola frondosa]